MPSYLVFLDFEGDRMEVEYFPPKGDVILQNAAPADLYVGRWCCGKNFTVHCYNSRPLTVDCLSFASNYSFLYDCISNRNSSCEKVELNR